MKFKNLKILLVTLLFITAAVSPSLAGGLSDRDAGILERAGIPVYPEAKYVSGTFSGIMGVRFATSASVDDVRKWYREKFPGWSLYSKLGGWILYKGAPGAALIKIMGMRQVSVVEKKQMPEWYDLPRDMTTEIIITAPDLARK